MYYGSSARMGSGSKPCRPSTVDPARRALLHALLHASLHSVAQSPEEAVVRHAQVLLEHHIRPDVARRLLPPTFRQYASSMRVHSLVSVPVLSAHGRVCGALTMARGADMPPFTNEHVVLLQEMATWVARALDRVSRFSAAWAARESLLASVESLVEALGDIALEEVIDVLHDLLDDDAPEAVFTLDRRLLAASSTFMSQFQLDRLPSEDIWANGPLRACLAFDERVVWARLLSGEADLLDVEAGACESACPAVLGVHWAVARRPDGTPVAVVASCDAEVTDVAEAAPTPPAEPPPERCWGICVTSGTTRRVALRGTGAERRD